MAVHELVIHGFRCFAGFECGWSPLFLLRIQISCRLLNVTTGSWILPSVSSAAWESQVDLIGLSASRNAAYLYLWFRVNVLCELSQNNNFECEARN
jgi:hypothetical protein